MMWKMSSSLLFVGLEQSFATAESLPMPHNVQSSAVEKAVTAITKSSSAGLSEAEIQDSDSMNNRESEAAPSKSTWLQYLTRSADEIEDDICFLERSEVVGSWGHFEFLERTCSRGNVFDPMIENNCEPLIAEDEDEKEDHLLIFQMEL